MDNDERLKNYDNFCREFEQIKQQYSISKSPKDLMDGIRYLSENPAYRPFARYLFFIGSSYMENGDLEAGAACMKAVVAYFSYQDHLAVLYIRMAQYHIEKGNTKLGIVYLSHCTKVADFQNQIATFNLIKVWEKYKSLVPSEVPELFINMAQKPATMSQIPQPKKPDECSQTIAQILSLPEENLLSNLSAHLREITANGTDLNRLNKWERKFYYADEMCMEINSGGFEGYLYYHGTHFMKACQVFDQIGAEQMLGLAEQIQKKFPRGHIPKSQDAIQNAMDCMEEKGVAFDDEDEIYYSSAEKELLNRLLTYVKDNQKYFR